MDNGSAWFGFISNVQPLAPAAKDPQPHININHNRPLTEPTIFCNTDASWKAQSAGLAWIFSTQSEAELGRKALSLHFVSSPCMAEALVIRGALLHAASLNYTNICLRTDSQVLFGAINKRIWTIELFGILSDIDSLVFHFHRLLLLVVLFLFHDLPTGLLMGSQKPTCLYLLCRLGVFMPLLLFQWTIVYISKCALTWQLFDFEMEDTSCILIGWEEKDHMSLEIR